MVTARTMRELALSANKGIPSPDVLGAIDNAASQGAFSISLCPSENFGINFPPFASYRQLGALEPHKRSLELLGFEVEYRYTDEHELFVNRVIVKW